MFVCKLTIQALGSFECAGVLGSNPCAGAVLSFFPALAPGLARRSSDAEAALPAEQPFRYHGTAWGPGGPG